MIGKKDNKNKTENKSLNISSEIDNLFTNSVFHGIEQGRQEKAIEILNGLKELVETINQKTLFTYKRHNINEWLIFKDGKEFQIIGAPTSKVVDMVINAHEQSYKEGSLNMINKMIDFIKMDKILTKS